MDEDTGSTVALAAEGDGHSYHTIDEPQNEAQERQGENLIRCVLSAAVPSSCISCAVQRVRL